MPVIVVGQVTVPNVTGMTLAAARAALTAVTLSDYTSLSRTFANTDGTIISQSPSAGTDVDPQTSVSLTLCSRGSREIRIIRDIDVTRPNTPTGLAGVGASEAQINLSWNAATDPQGAPTEADSGVVGYEIWRNGAFLVGLPNTSVQVPGLSAYTLYSFQVLSVDGAGNKSVLSTAVSVRTLDTTAPSAPTITASQGVGASINVALTVPSSDSGSGL